jgi:CDP-diacylglycerol--glycerol-3-phosphate 3-phosphatidyltransferase
VLRVWIPEFDTQNAVWDKRSAHAGPRRPAIVDRHTGSHTGGRGDRRRRGGAPTERTDRDRVLNIHARRAVSNALVPLGERLARAGVTPNAITVVGTVGVVAAALVFFTRGWWFTGTMVIWGFAMLDLVDGAVARAGGTSSPFGGVLDSAGDRVADAAVFGALAWYFARHGQRWLLLAALLCLVLGSLTSYIRARAEAAGMSATVGIAERADRLIIVLVGTGLTGENLNVPYVQAIALWLLVAASTITVAQRLVTVHQQSHARTEAVRT